ncbi:MAG: stage II sporulation protein M [Kofleriaceae bacterium]|nr:stage II sporulation protein M [Kofleriaceae bacterium]MCB9571565.1 stage II sporulation protein M [Kofleriaceae bacterium]
MPAGAGVSAERTLRSVEFRREREGTWRELEQLIALVRKDGIRDLTAEQLARLPHLYRATLSSLSVARSISLDRALTDYLESLCGRAYFCVYGARDPTRGVIAEYLTWRLPAAIRSIRWQLALAALFLVLGAMTAFFMVRHNSEAYYTFVQADYASGRTPASTTAELRAGLYDDTSVSAFLATFAAELFSHNARIGLLAFALGVVVIPTLLLMFTNGLILGAFAALYDSRGLSWDLWGWLLPHGVTELSAVVLCGAAGLVIGQSWIFPGARPRLDNLRERGRLAGLAALGAVLMFFVAGLIEGIFRQTVTNIELRYAVAVATAGFWIWYFGFCGRGRERLERRLAEGRR